MNSTSTSIRDQTTHITEEPAAASEVLQLEKRIRMLLGFFAAALLVSGLTALPLVWESALLARYLGQGSFLEPMWPAMAAWISYVHQGLAKTNQAYPFLFYGTDWLAFAHIMIAINFIGPLRDPVRNRWVVEFSMIACLLIIPTVLIFAPLRGIPVFWRVIDLSFGVFGLLPLWLARRDILALARLSGG
jgi:hypothetical protein